MPDLAQNILFRNFGWKMLSLALAIAIWLTVRTISAEQGQTERMFINQEIQIVSGTADVRTFRIEPITVNVTVKGRPGAISRLVEREIRVFADLTSADLTKPFRQHLDIAVPNGITVVRFEPTEVQVTPPPRPEPKIIISAPKTNQ
jgi:YbbR domain-containing protein